MQIENEVEKLIQNWPNRQAFADAVGEKVATVHKWARFGRIPSGKQRAVIDAARTSGVGYVTADWMVDVHAVNQEAS